ncbi:hypothetical protein LTR51_001132 [Lithohypha guttulata]|nr:hypothetical protein LTR51_001132 [Lithohypha guttulata]
MNRYNIGKALDKRQSSLEDVKVEVVQDNRNALWRRTKTSFFGYSRNWKILLTVLGVVILLLVILLPVLLLVDLNGKKEPFTDPIDADDAARYAVVKHNFPDPTVIEVNNTLYAFATRSGANASLHVQVARSALEDVSFWTLSEGYDALPILPSWVKSPGDAAVWAPQVNQRDDGMFVMLFSALHSEHTNKHCLGIATILEVIGPYTATSQEPLVCHFELGGIIDPTFLVDPTSNTSYIVYKNDGNAIGSGGACSNSNWPNTPTTFQYDILTSNLTESALTSNNGSQAINTVNNSTIFLHNDCSDGSTIESPFIVHHAYHHHKSGKTKHAYHLLYNSGCFVDSSYRIEHIPCLLNDTITHFTECPWQELKNSVGSTLLESASYAQPDNDGKGDAVLFAPGGPAVSPDGRYLIFHADVVEGWNAGAMKRDAGEVDLEGERWRMRAMFVAEMEYEYDWGKEGEETMQTGLRVKRLVVPSN